MMHPDTNQRPHANPPRADIVRLVFACLLLATSACRAEGELRSNRNGSFYISPTHSSMLIDELLTFPDTDLSVGGIRQG